MALVLKTFISGNLIKSSEVNSNFSLINAELFALDNTNIAPAAGIVDTKLAQITTGSKVHGSSIVTESIEHVVGAFGWFLEGTQTIADQQAATNIVSANLTVVDCKMYCVTAPTGTGSLEIDIQYKRAAGGWTSLFTTLPQILVTTNVDDGLHVLDDPVPTLQSDDLLRFNVEDVGGTEPGQDLTVILTCSQAVPQ